jgi:phosphatidylglycerophosphate synthase
MLDGAMRRIIDPPVDAAGRWLAARGVRANHVTTAGLILGLAAAAAVATGHPLVGLVVLLLSRLCDGLDGAVARASSKTDLGGYLDIVFDFAFYGAIPFAFILADPANAIAGSTLLLAFYINGASFLAYATIAAKRGLETTGRGEKSIYFTAGLAEGTETIGVFIAMCLFPGMFVVLAFGFAALCFVTAASRVAMAIRAFG